MAVVRWSAYDELAESIRAELLELGQQPVLFAFDESLPAPVDVVLTFAPYNRWWPIARQIPARSRTADRPIFAHWNFEGQPNQHLPSSLVFGLGAIRSGVDRLNDSASVWRWLVQRGPLAAINRSMFKFRYMGEYAFALRQRILDMLIESSQVYADRYRQQGLPVQQIAWGTSPSWYADLKLERDIDVVWLGKRRTRRRSQNLDRLRRELAAAGIELVVIDGVEQPFVFDVERIKILNRAKITLNLLPTVDDNCFPFRFHQAAGNRSMVISEPLMPHDARYVAGRHYAVSPIAALADTLKYYLQHEAKRAAIAENAYQLVTTELTLRNSLAAVVEAVAVFQSSLKRIR
jgi:hypothetical protein